MPKQNWIKGTVYDYSNSKIFILCPKKMLGFRTYPHRSPTRYSWVTEHNLEMLAFDMIYKGV